MMSFRDACRTHIIIAIAILSISFIRRSDRESGRLGGSATAGSRSIFLPTFLIWWIRAENGVGRAARVRDANVFIPVARVVCHHDHATHIHTSHHRSETIFLGD
jgi:hypothetical protein